MVKKYQFWRRKEKNIFFLAFHDQNLNARACTAFTLWFCSSHWVSFVTMFWRWMSTYFLQFLNYILRKKPEISTISFTEKRFWQPDLITESLSHNQVPISNNLTHIIFTVMFSFLGLPCETGKHYYTFVLWKGNRPNSDPIIITGNIFIDFRFLF